MGLQSVQHGVLRLCLPCVFVLQLQLLLRYLPVTAEEARLLVHAYLLRNPGCSIVPVWDWGVLQGSCSSGACIVRMRAIVPCNAGFSIRESRFRRKNLVRIWNGGAVSFWLFCYCLFECCSHDD